MTAETEQPETKPTHPIDQEVQVVTDWQNMSRGGVFMFGLLSAAQALAYHFLAWELLRIGSACFLAFALTTLALLMLHGFIVATVTNVMLRRAAISTAVTSAYLQEIDQALKAGTPMDQLSLETLKSQGEEGSRVVAFLDDYRRRMSLQEGQD